MHLLNLKLSNFRGFRSLDLAFDRHLTVLVGRNGSGKSSVLDAIRAVLLLNVAQKPAKVRRRLSGSALRTGATEGTIQLSFRTSGPPGEETTIVHYNPTGGFWGHWYKAPYIQEPIFYGMDRSLPGERVTQARLLSYWSSEADEEDKFTVMEHLIAWFREREDVENQERVRRRDLDFLDPSLEAARQAIQTFLGVGYRFPRIDRSEETRLLIDKDGQTLSATNLSDGERSLIVIAGDLARRFAGVAPNSENVREIEAIVLIDEIELHLHPSWQQRIVDALRQAFPNAQFILTTHSPQVLSQVPAASLRILDNFQVYSPSHPVRGRDANAILREVMGTTERPRFVQDLIEAVGLLIDQERLDEAHIQLNGLCELLGPDDSEVLRLGTMLHFLGDTSIAPAEGS